MGAAAVMSVTPAEAEADLKKRLYGKDYRELSYEIREGFRKNTTVLVAEGLVYIFEKKDRDIHYMGCRYKRNPHKCKARGLYQISTGKFMAYGEHSCDQNVDKVVEEAVEADGDNVMTSPAAGMVSVEMTDS